MREMPENKKQEHIMSEEVKDMPQVVLIGLIGLAGRAIAVAVKKSKK